MTNEKEGFYSYVNDTLDAIRGKFKLQQLTAFLNMQETEISKPENYVIWFHERFHHLETIFTPYGHLKWGSYRTVSADVINYWLSLTDNKLSNRKIPIAQYLNNPNQNDIKVVTNIWMQDWMYQIYAQFERGITSESLRNIFGIENKHIGPQIILDNTEYQIKGIDILESFAKFQEAVLGDLIGNKKFSETLDINNLNPEYFSALIYFFSKVGSERFCEFPIACELSLAVSHLPHPKCEDSFERFSIGYRFAKIVDYISNHPELKNPNIFYNSSFFDYANRVLSDCGFETYETIWDSAEEYVTDVNLEIAKEMRRAITYKKNNPWMLSFPFRTIEDFSSQEFNSFNPLITATNDTLLYSLNSITPTELMFELHFQALSMQICGRMSERCMYPNMLQCGCSYFGINNCQHQLRGECDGYIDKTSILPELEFDENSDIKSGCTMELILLQYGSTIKEIEVGNISKQVDFFDIKKVISPK